jgi:hypothetical protein
MDDCIKSVHETSQYAYDVWTDITDLLKSESSALQQLLIDGKKLLESFGPTAEECSTVITKATLLCLKDAGALIVSLVGLA